MEQSALYIQISNENVYKNKSGYVNKTKHKIMSILIHNLLNFPAKTQNIYKSYLKRKKKVKTHLKTLNDSK